MSDNARTLRVLHYPHPALRAPGERIDKIDDEVRAIAERMLTLMREHEGVGLAAPQVGLALRLFVTGEQEGEPARVYINPTFSDAAGETEVRQEGCLSLPDVHVDVRRPVAITITATDLDGREFTLRTNALLARVWQHEMDHLNGVLIIDRMSTMDRLANRRALKALRG